MPTGIFIRRRNKRSFKKEYATPQSGISIEWLAKLERDNGIDIQHARKGPEYRVGTKKIPVDGYDRYVYHILILIYNSHAINALIIYLVTWMEFRRKIRFKREKIQ